MGRKGSVREQPFLLSVTPQWHDQVAAIQYTAVGLAATLFVTLWLLPMDFMQ